MGMPGVKTDIYYVLRDTHSLVNATQGFLIDRYTEAWMRTQELKILDVRMAV